MSRTLSRKTKAKATITQTVDFDGFIKKGTDLEVGGYKVNLDDAIFRDIEDAISFTQSINELIEAHNELVKMGTNIKKYFA